MRDALKNAIHNAILFECKLPHQESGLDKSCLSSQNDICFSNSNPQEISKIIYNGIVEFAINEYEIDYNALEREQRKAILSRIRYNPEASEDTKLKYGFYGEVLLDLILRVFLNTSVLAARGYFYSPIENSEAKGFDAFHLVEREGNIDLWFGEAKFYVQYPKEMYARTLLKDQMLISSFQETCSVIESSTYEIFLNHLEHTFGNDWIVLKALRGRIGIHHSLIPKYIQKEIIEFISFGRFSFNGTILCRTER